MPMSALSKRLVALRKARGLSQTAVANEIGIALRTYQYYERGEREPQLSILIRLADFYQVSLDTLVGHSSPPLKQSDD